MRNISWIIVKIILPIAVGLITSGVLYFIQKYFRIGMQDFIANDIAPYWYLWSGFLLTLICLLILYNIDKYRKIIRTTEDATNAKWLDTFYKLINSLERVVDFDPPVDLPEWKIDESLQNRKIDLQMVGAEVDKALMRVGGVTRAGKLIHKLGLDPEPEGDTLPTE